MNESTNVLMKLVVTVNLCYWTITRAVLVVVVTVM